MTVTLVEARREWCRSGREAVSNHLGAADHLDALDTVDPGRPESPAVVYVPGRWGLPGFWAVDEPARDLRVGLARAGHPSITVRFGISGRDELGTAGYRTKDFLEDIAVAVDIAHTLFPGRAVALCGYSMGATLSFLAAGCLAVAGVIALDGGLPAESLPPSGASGVVENPHLHPRAVRSALNRLATHRELDPDRTRWRLTQGRWWPAAQLDEVRTGRYADGLPAAERLAQIDCPVLAIAADDRDPASILRALRTAEGTSASHVQEVVLAGWTHEEVAIRADNRLTTEVLCFLRSLDSP